MALMQAPSSVIAGSTFKLPASGTTYAVDAFGFVIVSNQTDIDTLITQGFREMWGGRNNFIAVTDPSTGNDTTQDYAAGSLWLNVALNRAWICASAGTGAAVWIQLQNGTTTAGSGAFVNLTLTGLLMQSSAVAVTAFSGGGQGSATLLAAQINNITTATSSSAPYDSVKLPAVAAGEVFVIINSGANPIQVFGSGTDVIDAYATAVGVTVPVLGIVIFVAKSAGLWGTVNLGNGITAATAYNTNTATSGATLTAANISGGVHDVTLNLTGTLGAPANAQLPTAANLVAAIPNPVSGYSYRFRVINSSSGAFTWTVTTNTGWTLSGTMSVIQNTWRDFYVTFTSLTTITLQSIGTGTYS